MSVRENMERWEKEWSFYKRVARASNSRENMERWRLLEKEWDFFKRIAHAGSSPVRYPGAHEILVVKPMIAPSTEVLFLDVPKTPREPVQRCPQCEDSLHYCVC
jgi:hypothetical protein